MKLAPELEKEGWKIRSYNEKTLKSIWSSIKWRCEEIYHELRYLPRRIKKIFQYIPVLWKNEDFDYRYILELLKYKLERTSKEIGRQNHLANNTRVLKQINYAIFLLDRIIKDEYHKDIEKKIEDKYGYERLWLSKPYIRKGDTEEYHQMMFASDKSVHDVQLIEQEQKLRGMLYRMQDYTKEKDYERLFKHLHKFVRNWWD